MTVDPRPYARFVDATLIKPLPDFPGVRRAAAETEAPIEGDDWYWADDNAKLLELFSLPEVWAEFPDAVEDMVGFVCAMCDGPLIFRRTAAPRMDVEENRDGKARFTHALMNIGCDLARGEVALGMRFHDGRTARNAIVCGNSVQFRQGSRVHRIPIAPNIRRWSVTPFAGGARLTWTAVIEFENGWLPRRITKAGEVTYSCTLSARSMFVDFEATFAVTPGANLSDIVLDFGFRDLSHDEIDMRYEKVAVLEPGGREARVCEATNEPFTQPCDGARYWSVWQDSHQAGFAAGLHSLPREPDRVRRIHGDFDPRGRLQSAISEHVFDGPQTGYVTAAERKIITSGGFYGDLALYADMLERRSALSDGGAPPTDLSVSYDYGAEIYALARCLRTLQSRKPPISEARKAALLPRIVETLDALIEGYDRYFITPAHQDPRAIFSRSLAYYVFALAELYQSGGEARRKSALRQACDLLIRFERINQGIDGEDQSGFVMGHYDAAPFVDCHAACILALVRGSEALDIDDWAAAIDRGLSAFCLDTQMMLGRKADVVGVDFLQPDGTRLRLETYWNFKSGLCLQMINGLRATRHPSTAAVWEKHRLRMEIMEAVIRERLRQSTRERPEGIEVQTSVHSPETNSESQPWVVMGLIG